MRHLPGDRRHGRFPGDRQGDRPLLIKQPCPGSQTDWATVGHPLPRHPVAACGPGNDSDKPRIAEHVQADGCLKFKCAHRDPPGPACLNAWTSEGYGRAVIY